MDRKAIVSVAAAGAAAAMLYRMGRSRTSKAKAPETKSSKYRFPVVDLEKYLADPSSAVGDCKAVADMLHRTGLLIVRDPRVSMKNNDAFIDNMERYFGQGWDKKLKDVRKQYSYQIGATPEGVEQARNHCARAKSLPESERPVTECPPGKDPKWRYFWRIGDRPSETKFGSLNEPNVVPAGVPGFEKSMEKWGNLIMGTVRTVSQMAAEGFGMDRDAFKSLMDKGPHLLAPTGSDLDKFGKKNVAFASYHYDLNFLTIHGRSRFPGLFVWTRDNKRIPVSMPEGCLLLQAGKQFEYLTGGYVLAGFHEVVVSDATLAAIERAKKANRSTWRVSSTLFAHIASDNVLKPLGKFSNEANAKKYPPVAAGNQVRAELEAINLKQ